MRVGVFLWSQRDGFGKVHGRHLDILREPAVEELAKSFGPARMRQSASTRDRLA